MAGEIVAGRYRLVRELGAGGMGVVWVAHSLALGIDVAIKLIRADVADPELSSRMAREAQVTAALGHPAIVRVFDFGMTEHDAPFLAMELAQGETLGALLAREKQLGAVEALKLVLPIVDGLRCAHERGIVHRDIKPENVFIARDALGRVQPKLLDFGIAKLEHHPNVTRLTQVGVVLGSPEYMSPEQARGVGSVDGRTDIWALSVLIYEMLTGSVPFKVKNYNALMQEILHEPPVPTIEYGAGDRELWLILAKGLEKSRDKRWASMSELGEALAFWLADRGISEDAAGNSLGAVWLNGTLTGVSLVRPWRQRAGRQLKANRVVGAAVLAVSVGAFVWLQTARHAADASRAAAAAPTPAIAAAVPPAGAVAPSAAPTAASATPDGLEPAASPPLTSAAKRVTRAPARAAPAPHPSRRAEPPSASKSIRNFGF